MIQKILGSEHVRSLQAIENKLESIEQTMEQKLAEIKSTLDEALDAQQRMEQAARDREEHEARVRSLPPSAENAYRYFAGRYGIGYGRLDVECSIRPDGSAVVRRVVTVEAYSEIGELDTMLLIPESVSSDDKWDIDFLEVKQLREDEREVSLIEVAEEDGKLSALLSIAPKLRRGDSVSFEMREKLPAGLYAIDFTAEQLSKRKTAHDYFGWNIIRPVRKLSLAVYYPDGIKPNIYDREVRYASATSGIPAKTYHREEEALLDIPSLVGPIGGRYTLRLDVDYPMVRLIYILRWEPLETEERVEDRFRQEQDAEQEEHTMRAVRRPSPAGALSPSPGSPQETYNMPAIRNLLQDALSAQELGQFCGDRPTFEPVLDLFGPKFSKSEMVDTLLEYCQRREMLPYLLAEIKKVNPRQYDKYESDLKV